MGIPVQGMDTVEAWSGGSILGPGRHFVKIVNAEEGESSGGYPQVELEFQAMNGEGNIRDWLVFSGQKSLGKARMLLDACGIEPQGGDWQFPTEQLFEKQLYIVCADKPKFNDETKTVTKVVSYEEISGDPSLEYTKAQPSPGQADDEPLPF